MLNQKLYFQASSFLRQLIIEPQYRNFANSIFDTFLTPGAPVTKRIYSKALGKSIGDIQQEFNGCLKLGGYKDVPAYNDVESEPQIDKHSRADGVADGVLHEPERLVIANDQPSAARIIWMLQCLPPASKNMNAYGGYWNPGRQVLCSAENVVKPLASDVQAARGGRRRRTRRRKRKRRSTRRRTTRKKRTRRRRRRSKRRTKRR